VKTAGHVLLVLGTIVASLGGAKLPSSSVVVSGIGLALLVAAVVCLRWRTRSTTASATLSADDPRTLLRLLPDRLEKLAGDAPDLEPSRLMAALDAIGAELTTPIADGSTALLAELGIARFAAIFGPFASAERAAARAWSATADGHPAEARAAIAVALERARAAVSALDG
jgi:hypothetical protein